MIVRRPSRFVASLVLPLFCLQTTIGVAAVNLPNIGESTEAYLSTEDEQNYGEAFMRSIRESLELVADPEVQAYVETLGNRLVANAGIRDRKFSFFVVRDPTINAFAGPGGYVGVNTGLILTTHTEAELASVMAHEIGHVTQRHIARAFEAASRMSVPITAALIAGLILGTRAGSSGQVGEAAIAATAAGTTQQQINFTRSNEEEADRVGLQILADSNYEPRAMPRFFESLQQATLYADNLQLEFLRTHPVTAARISDTRNRAEQYPVMKETIGENYDLVRAKARIIQDGDPRKSLDFFEGSLRTNGNDDTAHYGYALALNAMGRYDEARTQLRPLIARDPERVPYQIALADAEIGSGHLADALAVDEKNLAIYPYNLPLTLQYANTLLQNRQAEKAANTIEDYLVTRPARPELYRLLAQARDMMGDPVAEHQALAEMYDLLGQIRPAIEQLRIATRDLKGKDVRAAKIRERIRTLEAEWKAKAKYFGESAEGGNGKSRVR